MTDLLDRLLHELCLPGAPDARRAKDLEAARDKLARDVATAGPSDPRAVHEAAQRRAALDTAELELLLRRAGAVGSEDDAEVVAWLNEIVDPDELVRRVRRDPVNVANGARPLDRKAARDILRRRNALDGRAFRELSEVGRVRSGHLADLRHSASAKHGLPNQAQSLPVLLPLRLETRFSQRADGGWRLRLLIVPDVPWFDAHDPLPSSPQLDALERWQQTVHDTGDADSPLATAAWSRLVSSVGGGRAAWLAKSFPVVGVNAEGRVIPSRPTELREGGRFHRVRDLPRTIDVYLGRSGAAPSRVARLAVQTEHVRVDFPSGPSTQWWESFGEAKSVGLGTEIDLGARADDIDVLYVVGLGDVDPSGLFASHRDSGRLALLRPGTPTNAIHGAATAGARLPDSAWLRAIDAHPNLHEQALSRLLAGDPFTLGALPQSPQDHPWWSRILIQALWPALFGHAFGDLWPGREDIVDALPGWALLGLQPDGPFPPLRVANQAYGILPVSPTRAWRALPALDAVESAIVPFVDACVALAASAAEAGGTVEGASTDRLLDLLGLLPASPEVRARTLAPAGVAALAVMLGGGERVLEMIRGWEAVMVDAKNLVQRELGAAGPRQPFIGLGDSTPIEIALVPESDEALREQIERFFEAISAAPERLADNAALAEAMGGSLPDNLLFRLALRSVQWAAADLGRASEGIDRPTMNDELFGLRGEPTKMQGWVLAFLRAAPGAPSPKTEVLRRCLFAIAALRGVPVTALDRLMRLALDSTSHRIDTWATALPWIRLQQMLLADPRAVRRLLGCYGWLDAPRPGTPGPTRAGLLLGPSDHHARTAAVLRDRLLSSEDGAWEMSLRSDAVRTAERLASAVREGVHPAEHLGRAIEGFVPPNEVERLRRRYPLTSAHEGFRPCDGRAILAADPAELGLDPTSLARIEELRTAVDTYGDLLLAEAAYRVVEGRADRAGSALDAAAGLAPPPELELLRPHRAARTVRTTCLAVLPAQSEVELPPDAATWWQLPPMRIAEPSLAAFVDASFDPNGWIWAVRHGLTRSEIGLSAIGLSASDALAFGTEELGALLQEVADPERTGVRIDDSRVTGPSHHAAAARCVRSFGHRPATPDDLSADAARTAPTTAIADAGLDPARILDRLDSAVRVAERLADELDRVATDVTSTRAEVQPRLVAARRWGIPVVAARTDEEARGLARSAEAQLRERLAAVPATADREDLDGHDLIAALRALVAPRGSLEIFETYLASDLPSLATGPTIEDEWLSVVAAVRPRLAALEATHLEGTFSDAEVPATALWSNRASDPWQTNLSDGRRLIVALAPSDLDLRTLAAGARVAVAAVDRFTEEIPERRHTASAAFGFNAPAARAPQAILVAVPPDIDAPVDQDRLLPFVMEARRLTRARAALPGLGALGQMAGATPVGVVPINGPMGVHVAEREEPA